MDQSAQNAQVPLWYDNFEFNGSSFRRSVYNYNRLANILPQLHIRDTDVCLLTYPRSGTHWTKYILACLYRDDADYESVRNNPLSGAVDWLDGMEADLFNGTATEEEQLEKWQTTTKPRLFCSHALPQILPPGVVEGKGKTILVVRNPKDVVVSLYHMMSSIKIVFTYEGSFDEFFSSWMAGKFAYGGLDYFSYYKSWWPLRNKIPMHIIYFEDLVRDTQAEIRRLADFLDRPISGAGVAAIADLVEFEKMKNSPCVAGVREVMKSTGFFRKGKVGDWTNHLTKEQSDEIDARMEKEMSDLDFVVKYE